VTYWVRRPDASSGSEISVWAVPTLGGQPKPYLEGAAEFNWSPDASQLAYHTPGPGDPLFISDGSIHPGAHPVFSAPPGLHAHYPLWSPDGEFIYFVQGTVPDRLDIWRIPSRGGLLIGSHRIIHASAIQSSWTGERWCILLRIVMGADRGSMAWTWNIAFHTVLRRGLTDTRRLQ
jgi:hypothetical protein